MSADTLRELNFLAESMRKKQSQVIQELIHRESDARRSEMRLAKLKALKGAFTGMIGDGQSIQTMKGQAGESE
ncbi:MAG: hypothetical protein A2286_05020 [Gammaproteobacteria bacterium RIFOXYA12_FULL_61_12]|nr:MAG: hypothetical protein A2286_05020 [Gammaproteobacteria bacterium RIFOXYA12_FULL_61_12]